MAFAGLDERQHLKAFILRAEAARKQGHGVRLLHEHELAREEVLQMHELVIVPDDRVGRLLERQQDVDAEAVRAAGADVAGFHDAAGGPGDDHEILGGDPPAEFHRLAVGRMILRQARRAEHGHLAAIAIGSEDLERVAQLLERRVQHLDLRAVGAVPDQLVGGLADLLNELFVAEG